jgi:D-alanyl-D-alanine carboxypeptidase
MDGINGVTARISEIRAMLHPAPAPAPASASAPAWTATSGANTSQDPSFAAALARAVAQPTSGTTPAASVAALQATYQNGRIPAEALTSLGVGDHRLAGPAAAAFTELQAAARRDGVRFGVTDSYRSYDAQVELAERKGLYSRGGLAAQPGTSQHGWGLAVDLDLDAQAQAWMRSNAARFGFVEDTPREPWHWAYES